MANKWRTATGNWSNAAQWNGGVLPSPGDDCYANNFTCTIDIEDLEYNLFTLANAGIGVVAGGAFNMPSSDINIVHRGDAKCGTTNCIVSVVGFTGTWTHESGTYEGGALSSSRYTFVWAAGIARVTLKGNYKGGTASANYAVYINPTVEGGYCVFNGAQIEVIGAQIVVYVFSNVAVGVSGTFSAIMGGGSSGTALSFNGAGVNAVITCTQATINTTYRLVAVIGPSIVEVTVIEFVFNSVTYASSTLGAFTAISNGYLKVTAPPADLSPYPLANLTWVYADNGGVIDYIGDIVCGYGTNSYALRTGSSGNSKIRQTGIFYGPTVFTLTSGAYSQVSTSMIVLDEVRAGDGGLPTLSGIIRLKSTGVLQIKEENGTMHSFVNSDEVGDPPAVTDVRDGVVYHFATLTGTCKVPGASSVAAGVEVDNTVGTAVITPSTLLAALGMASANMDSQLAALLLAIGNIEVDNGAIAAAVWSAATRSLTDKADFGLSSAAINAIEASLVNEGDSTALLQAIADKIAGDLTAGDLSALAIVSAIKADATLAQMIARIDANVSSRLATGSYVAPLNAADTRAAIGLESANLDTQLGEIATTQSSHTSSLAAISSGVATLLSRVTNTLFAGITSLGQWLGAMAGKQTADATALSEINATGAGSGTFAGGASDSLEAIRDQGDAEWSGNASGTGARTVTITVNDGSDVIPGAKVRATKSGESYVLETNASGQVTFGLDDGTWTISITKALHIFSPVSLVISANTTQTYSMTPLSFTESDIGKSTGYLYCYDENGDVASSSTVYISAVETTLIGVSLDETERSAISDENGLVQFDNMIRGVTYSARRGTSEKRYLLVVPESAEAVHQLGSIVGN